MGVIQAILYLIVTQTSAMRMTISAATSHARFFYFYFAKNTPA